MEKTRQPKTGEKQHTFQPQIRVSGHNTNYNVGGHKPVTLDTEIERSEQQVGSMMTHKQGIQSYRRNDGSIKQTAPKTSETRHKNCSFEGNPSRTGTDRAIGYLRMTKWHESTDTCSTAKSYQM
jgi:hypothetical protein